jgi:hypothetical protein
MLSRVRLGTLVLFVALVLTAGVPGFAKSARAVAFASDLVISGTRLPVGRYAIRWDAHTPRPTVEFVRDKKVVLSTLCTLEDRGEKYVADSVLYDTASDGTATIREIRFGGSSEVLVFGQGHLKITLRMYNYSISRGLLARSEGEATTILHQAGLEVAWVDCPIDATELKNYPDCQVPMGTADFVIKILTARSADRFFTNQEVLGQALECAREWIGCSAYVFHRDIQELTTYCDATEPQLLGHALAHEIGHLLLGPNSHTSIGVMRAHWRREDLQTIARAYLFFTDLQSRRIRDEVSARNTIQLNELARAKE